MGDAVPENDELENDVQDRRAGRRRRLRAAAAGVAAALAVGAAALTASTASAAPTETAGADAAAAAGLRAGDIPNPGAGFRIKFAYWVGEGVQTYTCGPAGTWNAASTPDAKLYAYGFLPPVHHFGSSVDPAGPRWEAKDGSTVIGKANPDKTVQKPGTIPWLLLDVIAHQGGGKQMADVTHISRIHTRGGVVPAGACSPGTTKAVPYGADYVFWAKR
jgi:hypothetical protein